MPRRWTTVLLCAALCSACPPPDGTRDGGGDAADARANDGAFDGLSPGMCASDADGDGVPDRFTGTGDADGDGVPNNRDPDADGDGRSNILEANAGHPYDCRSATPIDSDGDGTFDFLDLDSDGNGIPDAREFRGEGPEPDGGWGAHPVDSNADGTPDYADTDDDGDAIADTTEIAPGAPDAPADTDHDGRPDFRDDDSDADTIRDLEESARDDDGDGTPNFRDDDSDDDGIPDAREAGDADVSTPAYECTRELDAATLTGVSLDGIPDFRDVDSDNDGLSDREEVANGTDRCNPDTDGDGQLDLVEVVYCAQSHGALADCATDPSITIPATDYYLILPAGGPLQGRDLEFATDLRTADVFFLFDTTTSMSAVQQAVAHTIADPTHGMVASIRDVIADTYFGVGHYDDFPAGGYGQGNDRALHPLCDGPPGAHPTPECQSPGYGGIVMQPPARAADVQTGALAIPGGSGTDPPESQVEALYQTVTDEGLYAGDLSACGGAVGHAPCWIRPTACPETQWGYPCFRGGSLAVVVNFTDSPWHEGAPDVPGGAFYSPYVGIAPAPHDFGQMVAAYQRAGARQIHVNANPQGCGGRLYTGHSGDTPCYDMRMAAEGTGSVDLDGNALVYDLPQGASTTGDFVGLVTDAVRTLATRVPLDVTTATRNDASNPAMVDAARFVQRRVPSCQVDRGAPCWTEPSGVPHASAVARTDLSTFYRAVPGTRVHFTVFFQNDGVYAGARDGATVFHAFIDVVGNGTTVLDTREVYILVPVYQPPTSG